MTETKTIGQLDRNDMSYVPATTIKNGRTLSLANVEWQVTGTDLVGEALMPSQYQAVATYVNPSTGKVDTTASKMKAIDTQLYQVGRVSFLSYMSKYVCTDCYTYAKSLDSGYVNGFCNTNFKKK